MYATPWPHIGCSAQDRLFRSVRSTVTPRDKTEYRSSSHPPDTSYEHAQWTPAIVLSIERSSCMSPVTCTFFKGYLGGFTRG